LQNIFWSIETTAFTNLTIHSLFVINQSCILINTNHHICTAWAFQGFTLSLFYFSPNQFGQPGSTKAYKRCPFSLRRRKPTSSLIAGCRNHSYFRSQFCKFHVHYFVLPKPWWIFIQVLDSQIAISLSVAKSKLIDTE
jgi:hypothetical protein